MLLTHCRMALPWIQESKGGGGKLSRSIFSHPPVKVHAFIDNSETWWRWCSGIVLMGCENNLENRSCRQGNGILVRIWLISLWQAFNIFRVKVFGNSPHNYISELAAATIRYILPMSGAIRSHYRSPVNFQLATAGDGKKQLRVGYKCTREGRESSAQKHLLKNMAVLLLYNWSAFHL